MNPITEQELVEIRMDFIKLLGKNSELKAAYLAVTGRGFENMISHDGSSVLMERETDHRFIVCTHHINYQEPNILESRTVIRFHSDNSIFNGGI